MFLSPARCLFVHLPHSPAVPRPPFASLHPLLPLPPPLPLNLCILFFPPYFCFSNNLLSPLLLPFFFPLVMAPSLPIVPIPPLTSYPSFAEPQYTSSISFSRRHHPHPLLGEPNLCFLCFIISPLTLLIRADDPPSLPFLSPSFSAPSSFSLLFSLSAAHRRIYPPDDKLLLEKYESLLSAAFQTFLAGRAASLQKEMNNPLKRMKARTSVADCQTRTHKHKHHINMHRHTNI